MVPEDAEPLARPVGPRARSRHGRAPSFCSRLSHLACGVVVVRRTNPTTSTTTAVALSRPPAATAAATTRSAASRGSSVSRQDVGDLGVADHAGDAVGAEQEPLDRRQRQQEEVGLGAVRAAQRAGDDVALGMGRGVVAGDLAGVDQLLHDPVVDADLLELAAGEPVDPGVAEVGQQPLRAAVVLDQERRRPRWCRRATGAGRC